MNWLQYSILLGYFLIVILSIVSLVVQYQLFLSDSQSVHFATSFVEFHANFTDKSKYYNNIGNVNGTWYVFSVFVSLFLFAISSGYYTFIYGKVLLVDTWENKMKYDGLEVFAKDVFYLYSTIDFVFLSLNLSWSVLWILHLGIETLVFLSSRRTAEEASSLYLLLSLQIGLIALRYPQVFNTKVVSEESSSKNVSGTDEAEDASDFVEEIEMASKYTPKQDKDIFKFQNLKFKI